MRICVEARSTFTRIQSGSLTNDWKAASEEQLFFLLLAHIDSLAVVLLFSYMLVIVLFLPWFSLTMDL